MGNCVGRYEGVTPGLPCLMLGSHLDTVRDAGRYDGMLGVLSAIECVGALHATGTRLPFAIEVVGFGDEEGVRYGSTLLGSRAITGALDLALLDKQDAQGIAMRDALVAFGLDPAKVAHRRAQARRRARLRRVAHRAGAGAGGGAAAGGRGHRDQWRQSIPDHAVRHGRACGHGADDATPRRARGRRRVHPRRRAARGRACRRGRHRGPHRRATRRHERDSRAR